MTAPLPANPPDDTDRRLINRLQQGFPLSTRPFRIVADELGLDEADVLARIGRLRADGVLTRFGPMYQVEKLGGAFCLAAMSVPETIWDRVVAAVNALPEVAHNYRRAHRLNMWFVLATGTPEGIPDAIARIERETGLAVFAFPKEREYFVEMKLEA